MAEDPWAAFRIAKADPAPAEADPWAAFRPKAQDPAPKAVETPAPPPASDLPGDGSAAVGRGIINGVPVVGPYLLAGVNRGAAAVRALQNGTTFPEELKKVEAFGEETKKAHPWASTGGELLGGVVGTAPLVAAAPAAFGAGGGIASCSCSPVWCQWGRSRRRRCGCTLCR